MRKPKVADVLTIWLFSRMRRPLTTVMDTVTPLLEFHTVESRMRKVAPFTIRKFQFIAMSTVSQVRSAITSWSMLIAAGLTVRVFPVASVTARVIVCWPGLHVMTTEVTPQANCTPSCDHVQLQVVEHEGSLSVAVAV